MLREQLDRDISLEPVVEGELDGRHPAHAESALDPVAPRDQRHACHCPFPLPPPRPAPPLPLLVEVVPGPAGVPPDVLVVGGGAVWVLLVEVCVVVVFGVVAVVLVEDLVDVDVVVEVV